MSEILYRIYDKVKGYYIGGNGNPNGIYTTKKNVKMTIRKEKIYREKQITYYTENNISHTMKPFNLNDYKVQVYSNSHMYSVDPEDI